MALQQPSKQPPPLPSRQIPRSPVTEYVQSGQRRGLPQRLLRSSAGRLVSFHDPDGAEDLGAGSYGDGEPHASARIRISEPDHTVGRPQVPEHPFVPQAPGPVLGDPTSQDGLAARLVARLSGGAV